MQNKRVKYELGWVSGRQILSVHQKAAGMESLLYNFYEFLLNSYSKLKKIYHLNNLTPSVSRLSRKCGSFDVL
jgi:hypothetical protein